MAKKKMTDKIVCDTNVFIRLFRKDEETIDALEQIGNKNIVMPTISAIELCKGARSKNELKSTIDFIKRYSKLQLNNKGVELGLEFIKKYHLSHGLSLADALIASSVVMTKGLKLFTFNVKDFDYIKGLKLYYPPTLSKIKRKKHKL